MKRFYILTLFLLIVVLTANAQSEYKYVVHSSGNILGLGADNRADLLDPTSDNAVPLRIKSLSDGSYLLALDGEPVRYLSLGTNNRWSTYFLEDSTDTRAHYSIEESGKYVKLKNQSTNSYLGTDDNNIGAHVYSDKNGSDLKHLWRLSDTPEVEILIDTLSYAVAIDARRQTVEGWGVSLCWWANMCGKWSDAKIDQIIEWMVSPQGLNWNIFRYNIGGGDDPEWTNCTPHHMGEGKGLRAEMEGFQDQRGGPYIWNRDAAQRKIMLKIREKRPDAIFEAFSNSCPWWMTVSGCVSGHKDGGKDNLRTDYYEDFAHYLVDVCKHYKDEYGIEFKTLEPFNEAVTNYWYQSGGQEGCHFDPQSQVDFIRVLEPILKESGLSTIISASDETNTGTSLNVLRQYESSGVINLIGQWNTHSYQADTRSRSQIGSMARADGKVMWMSETGAGGTGLDGNLNIAQRIMDDMRYIAPSAWLDWQYMEEANDQWCFIRGKFADASYKKVKNYYVRQQFTRFIRQGYHIVESFNEQSLAAINPEADTLIVVVLNRNARNIHRIYLPLAQINGSIQAWRTSETESLRRVNDVQIVSDSIIEVTQPDMSITTLIIPIQPRVAYQKAILSGDTYLIIPQSNVNMAVSADASQPSLAPVNLYDPAQRWTITEEEPGIYRLRNLLGRAITFGTQYNMSASLGQNHNQLFNIEIVDDIHVRIMLNKDSKLRAWDLQNAKLNTGTAIGAYTYGESAGADTRNWLLVRVASTKDNASGIERLTNEHISSKSSPVIYSADGKRLQAPLRGINILHYPDGTTDKIIIK